MTVTTPQTPEPLADPRRSRLSIALVFGVHGAVSGTFVTRIPWIQDRLDLSPGQLGLALVMPAIGSSLAMPLAGRFVHRHGGRAAVRGLISLWCLALALPALAPSLPALCAVLLVYGATAGTADVAMNAQGVEIERCLGRSIMSGLHGMWSAGGLLASGFGILAAHLDLDARLQLAVTALVLLALAQPVCRSLPDFRAPEAAEEPPHFALPPRSSLVIGLVGFCAVFAEGASMDWSGVYLKTVTGASATLAAASYTAFSLTMAVSRLAGDAVIRRLGAVRATRLGGATATLGGVLVVAADHPALAIPGFALIGVGIAVIVPLAFAAAGRIGSNPSQAIAGVATVTYTSGLVAPAVIGALAQATSLTVSFGLVTLLAFALLLSAGALRRAEPDSTDNKVTASSPGNTSGKDLSAI
ncbi:MFS transporter [Kitasatospora aureofaciens]|uniref:Transporter n=1 Tax=Kitasatospora aureofaciens TaxID=1894 RepID=A0A1E7N7N3_KITAU|nr:MFS transporter [Kitasatospora aureofaciens]QEV02981.1 MFS transporter [Streptomyces viridifaciens]ARF81525.1 MFS transporter [Kitasatospora aureofaciens]OEV36695.1 transporter [Kitasatospora aureofaciens]UKZ09609.1 MFS transporter [Streptomyces viridifaciens]GGU58092.1 MFS transporter [Kitasatospora aureofaciens]